MGTSEHLYVAAHQSQPQASTAKLLIAIHTLSLVDSGVLSMDERHCVAARHRAPGPASFLVEPGCRPTLRELLELSLRESDNTAPCVLLDVSGGAEAVGRTMAAAGLDGVVISRSIRDVVADYYGLDLCCSSASQLTTWRAVEHAVSSGRRRAARREFFADTRDVITPAQMLAVLESLWSGALLSSTSRGWLLDAMSSTAAGKERLTAGVPAGIRVAHKTGTLDGSLTADVGQISAPGGEDLGIAIYLRGSGRTKAQSETIAGLTRILWSAVDMTATTGGRS